MDITWILTTTFSFFLLYSTFFLFIPSHNESAIATGIQSNGTETDRLALLAIKAKITDGPSHVLSSWNDSLSFCKWQGVTCSPRRPRVIKLDLRSQGLVGSLSPFIGNLTFLRSIFLLNNSFHDEIPPEIGRLYRLRVLVLDDNSFTGKFPVNISGCTNLQKLLLSFNNLMEGKIPSELGSLSKLEELTLQRINLTGYIPSFIGNLSSLQVLSLNENSFEGGIPNSLGQLKSLRWFGLGDNMLSGKVPPSLYNLSSLSTFILTQNKLNGNLPPNLLLPNLRIFHIGGNYFSGTIPVSLFNVSGLQSFAISQNNLSGKIPAEVGNLLELQLFYISGNGFGNGKIGDLDFITALTNCSNLRKLDMTFNHFGGMLPNSMTNLSSELTNLYIGGNKIHGSIPSGISKYINLIVLGMDNNFFMGIVPPNIGMLDKLQVLDFGGNRLSGQLPSSLGNMSGLYYLNLTSNIFEGSIPSEIMNYQLLQELYLSYNNFSGTIPEEVINLSSQLRYLELAHNSLSGPLPIQLGNFIHLLKLDVSENRLSGKIPDTIGGCLSLESLILKGNFFQGCIPKSIKSLKEMRNLDLSVNNFSGEILQDLEVLPLLQSLNLSFNNLKGRVPAKGIFQNVSAFSILENHKLCGGITELHLPSCHIQRPKKVKMSSTLKVMLGVVICIILALPFVVFALYRRKRPKTKPSSDPFPKAHFERVSYHELCQATNGFSSDNLIGEGSFGSVYKGILNEDEGTVAIKVLNLIERGASKSFYNECEALRKIRHRNLVKILTVCSSVDSKGSDFKALVLKFMPNGNLENFLHPSLDQQQSTKVLSLFERLNIAIDIASALDYLHNRCETPIVHCDLKPSNILLDEDMTAYVGDFGLAKFLLSKNASDFKISECTSSSLRGTIGYIPPEYGIGTDISTQGDVYSYGMLLLEMITGKKPTDDIFKDGLTLPHFSSMALSLRAMDIIDPQMFLDEGDEEVFTNLSCQGDTNDRMQECIVSIVKIGVACSVEAQSKRMTINDALKELHVIKKAFLRVMKHGKTSSDQVAVEI